jgi:nitroimidazol reductase NimA-like FMN-containing flavoprotein (pyridoxamine 5'-phosphate oxidase superfamily)
VSRRAQITMSAAEVLAFLAVERTVTCATLGPRGWPHLMPLWYVLREGSPGDRPAASDAPAEPSPRLWSWTYAASQKVRNLERDARATLQVETGEAYEELRGVMLECDVVIHRELDAVARLGAEILLRNSVPRGEQPPAQMGAEALRALQAQAAKRVGLEFVERRRASWDHRKLSGVY